MHVRVHVETTKSHNYNLHILKAFHINLISHIFCTYGIVHNGSNHNVGSEKNNLIIDTLKTGLHGRTIYNSARSHNLLMRSGYCKVMLLFVQCKIKLMIFHFLSIVA